MFKMRATNIITIVDNKNQRKNVEKARHCLLVPHFSYPFPELTGLLILCASPLRCKSKRASHT